MYLQHVLIVISKHYFPLKGTRSIKTTGLMKKSSRANAKKVPLAKNGAINKGNNFTDLTHIKSV